MRSVLDDLFAASEPPVYRFLLRLCGDQETASELTQETLAIGWQRRHQLRKPSSLRPWLLRIAHNTFCQHMRLLKRQREQGLETLYGDEFSSTTSSPSQLSDALELGKQIWKSMDDLPPRQNQVLHLRVIEQLTMREIADVLSISERAVRSNLAAARKRMRVLLGDSINESTNSKANR